MHLPSCTPIEWVVAFLLGGGFVGFMMFGGEWSGGNRKAKKWTLLSLGMFALGVLSVHFGLLAR